MTPKQRLALFKLIGRKPTEQLLEKADLEERHRELKSHIARAPQERVAVSGHFGTTILEVKHGNAKTQDNAHRTRGLCLCCEKPQNPLTMDYHVSVGGMLCPACKKKVMKCSPYGTVDGIGLLIAQESLEEERELSRLGNKLYNEGPHAVEKHERLADSGQSLVCPRCLKADELKPTAINRMYICERCATYFRRSGKTFIWEQNGSVYKSVRHAKGIKLMSVKPIVNLTVPPWGLVQEEK